MGIVLEIAMKVALIGVGQRACSHIIPALVRSRRVEISNVYGSKPRVISVCGFDFTVAELNASSGPAFADVDSIIVCVPQRSIMQVLRRLAEFGCRDKTIFIDTPVLDKKNVLNFCIVAQFTKLSVLEDWLSLPTFSLASSLIRSGKVGKLRRIYFHHSGYRHHAMAILRYWTGSGFVKKGRFLNHSSEVKEFVLHDEAGVMTTIIEPREYLNGQFLIVGEKGSIGNYPIPARNHYWIKVVREETRLLVSTIDDSVTKGSSADITKGGEAINMELQIDPELSGMPQMDIMKIYGLIRIFEQKEEASDSLVGYQPLDAIYDKLIMDLLTRLGRIYDFALFGASALKSVIKMFRLIR